MTYDILKTGSTGNAVFINGEILIDCGVPMKLLLESGYIKSLKLVLLTHEHGDHFRPSTVRALHKERPALRWGCCEWMVPHLLNADVDKRVIDVYIGNEEKKYWDFAFLTPIPLVHDVQNCGYKIAVPKSKDFNVFGVEKIFYATDTGTLSHIEAKNYDLYLLEANHTQPEIAARIAEKQERGKFAYEYRAAQNHLSQEQALDWLARNAGPQSRYVFLHGHKEKEMEE